MTRLARKSPLAPQLCRNSFARKPERRTVTAKGPAKTLSRMGSGSPRFANCRCRPRTRNLPALGLLMPLLLVPTSSSADEELSPMSIRTLLLATVAALGLTAASKADDKYYLMVFAAQAEPNVPAQS